MIKEKRRLASKKGFIQDLALILVFLVVFAILAVVGYQVFTDLNTDLQADPDMSNASKAISDDLHNRYPGTLDGAFILFLGLIYVFGLVAAFVSDNHPVLLIVFVILIVFIMLAAAMLSNTWEEFVDDPELGSFGSNFPMTDFVINHFLSVIGVMGFTVLLVAFIKNKWGY